jgi:drug/metabolite transporter (DMT)-like permease
MTLALGILAAVGASTLYSLGVAFQAMEAKEAPQEVSLRLALAWRLVRSGRWLFGTGLSILGFPLQLLAVHLAPLVVVQPALATGLIVLMLAGERMLGERPGRYEYICVCAIVVGVAGAAIFAPQNTTETAAPWKIALVLSLVGALALVPYVLRLFKHPLAGMTIFCAGCAFAWSGIATKLSANDLWTGPLFIGLLWAASTAPASGVGTLSEMSALQSRPAIQVAPVVFVTQTVIPVIVAPILFGEYFDKTPLQGWPLVASLLVLVAGAGALARSPLLLAMMEGQPVSASSDSTDSPRADSSETSRSNPSTDSAEPSTETTSTSPA